MNTFPTGGNTEPTGVNLATVREVKKDDPWVMVGVCSGVIALPGRDVAEFHRGFREAVGWMSIPVAIVVLLGLVLA
jgi:hypothetical protein